jgi:hypothetical protein
MSGRLMPLQTVTKRHEDLEVHERRLSAPRTALAAAGATGVAYGAPRIRMIGIATQIGQRSPIGARRTVANAAARAGRTSYKATTGLPALVHRTPGVGGAVDLVPARLRPTAAMLGGAWAIRRAMPLHQNHYRPVVGVPVRGAQ